MSEKELLVLKITNLTQENAWLNREVESLKTALLKPQHSLKTLQ